jgi:hypothetical protein
VRPSRPRYERIERGRRQAVVAFAGPAGIPALLAVVVRLAQPRSDPVALPRLGDACELVQEIGQDLVALALEPLLPLHQPGKQGPLGHRELGCGPHEPALDHLHDPTHGVEGLEDRLGHLLLPGLDALTELPEGTLGGGMLGEGAPELSDAVRQGGHALLGAPLHGFE